MTRKQAQTIPFQARGRYYARTTAKRCQYWDGETDAQGCAVLPTEDGSSRSHLSRIRHSPTQTQYLESAKSVAADAR